MKTAFGLVLALSLAASAFGSDASSDARNALGVSFLTGVWSKYVDMDGYVYDDGAVSQSELTVSGQSGLYLNVWHTAGHVTTSREITSSIGWAREGIVNIDVGYSYDDFNRLFRGPAGDLHVLYAKVGKTFESSDRWSITPQLEINRYKPGKGSHFKGGFRARAGFVYSRRLFDTRIEGETMLVRDDGTFGSLPAWILNQSLGLAWKWGKATIGVPRIVYISPSSQDSGRAKSFIFGADVGFDF